MVTNRLIHELSPYLLQHAHNPVDWFPWGTEAFEKAKREGKPIFLSIGYSACHWCHVMEKESFESESIAKLLNDHFISIKVDREERPDVDGLYMTAVQMITGRGGWPMSVFMDENGRPFYAGTYFPPQDKYNMPGFGRVLTSLSHMWTNRRDELFQSAKEITESLGKSEQLPLIEGQQFSLDTADQAVKMLVDRLDSVHGGFSAAPKFPGTMGIQFLIRHHHFSPNESTKKAIELSLTKMANGGIYDHIRGGFARYSVDAEWHVPHFEKMLYDQALLSRAYTEAAISLESEHFRQVSIGVLDFVLQELLESEFGYFYSALDADSEGIEGKFYSFTKKEIEEILPAANVPFFCEYFNVTDSGNWEHTNVLRILTPFSVLCRRFNIELIEGQRILNESISLIKSYQNNRIRPGLDDKQLTGWNALMASSFAYAGFHFNRKDYLAVAEKSIDWIWATMFDGKTLYRVFKNGIKTTPGFIEDYGNLLFALVDGAQWTGRTDWLIRAEILAKITIDEFYDYEEGGFFVSPNSGETLIVKQKDFYDNAVPSGNSSALWALTHLFQLTHNELYEKILLDAEKRFSQPIKNYLSAFGWVGCAMFERIKREKEVILLGDKKEIEKKWLQKIREKLFPGTRILFGESVDFPVYVGKQVPNIGVSAFICENFVCHTPITHPKEFETNMF